MNFSRGQLWLLVLSLSFSIVTVSVFTIFKYFDKDIWEVGTIKGIPLWIFNKRNGKFYEWSQHPHRAFFERRLYSQTDTGYLNDECWKTSTISDVNGEEMCVIAPTPTTSPVPSPKHP